MASGLVFGQGQAAAYLVAPIARNPCTVCPKWSFTLLSFAFMESLCIYGLKVTKRELTYSWALSSYIPRCLWCWST